MVGTGAWSTTCGTDHVTVFLQLAWPVGTPVHLGANIDSAATSFFVRDTSDPS